MTSVADLGDSKTPLWRTRLALWIAPWLAKEIKDARMRAMWAECGLEATRDV